MKLQGIGIAKSHLQRLSLKQGKTLYDLYCEEGGAAKVWARHVKADQLRLQRACGFVDPPLRGKGII